ncbi:hypothetical protein D5018_18300 [Parashewanella curva]|uniref:Uncharacterized protein n=1 Tax=Parashewanella curva TaxID=2338552 RepID=A0A3L8PSB2_9GAMM|nr:hypothetical protein [Parashewanella curva]RLV58256.1 hypothetical protein D5018_18300 [Parashewanella curva]
MYQPFSLSRDAQSGQQMLQSWCTIYPKMANYLDALISQFPFIESSITQLSNFVGAYSKINDYPIFDICMCKGILCATHYLKSAHIELELFESGVTAAASSCLKGIYIEDKFGFEWKAMDGIPLTTWLERKPERLKQLNSGTLMIANKACDHTCEQLQQLLFSKMFFSSNFVG